jgi:hypothetical protein
MILRRPRTYLTLFAVLLSIQGCSRSGSPWKTSEVLVCVMDMLSVVMAAISPDGRRYAFVTKGSSSNGETWAVVVDGKKGKVYDEVLTRPIFSSDSRRLIYAARAGARAFIVVDGEEGRPYDFIFQAIFSPDGRHSAYVAGSGGKYVSVVDGVEGKAYPYIEYETLKLNRDGGRVAYWAYSKGPISQGDNSERQCFLVADGKQSKPYPSSDKRHGPLFLGSLAEFVGKRAVEKAASWKSPKGRTFPLRLRILQQRQDFHFSHRPDDGCTFQFPLGTKNS